MIWCLYFGFDNGFFKYVGYVRLRRLSVEGSYLSVRYVFDWIENVFMVFLNGIFGMFVVCFGFLVFILICSRRSLYNFVLIICLVLILDEVVLLILIIIVDVEFEIF